MSVYTILWYPQGAPDEITTDSYEAPTLMGAVDQLRQAYEGVCVVDIEEQEWAVIS